MKLTQKLAAISKSAGTIKKDGWNKHQKYSYLKIDDIYDHFNKLLSDHEVVFSTIVDQYQIDGNLIHGLITGVFTYNDEVLTCQVGSAARTGDKMMRNLMQNAVKQIFLQVFCISSGDPDPDGEPNTELKEETKTQETAITYTPISEKLFTEKLNSMAAAWNGESVAQSDDLRKIIINGMGLLLKPLQYDQLVELKSIENEFKGKKS